LGSDDDNRGHGGSSRWQRDYTQAYRVYGGAIRAVSVQLVVLVLSIL
jgi:hypothetical protein